MICVRFLTFHRSTSLKRMLKRLAPRAQELPTLDLSRGLPTQSIIERPVLVIMRIVLRCFFCGMNMILRMLKTREDCTAILLRALSIRLGCLDRTLVDPRGASSRRFTISMCHARVRESPRLSVLRRLALSSDTPAPTLVDSAQGLR